MFSQKDIVLIPFPYSDLTGSKFRPALIISNEKLNKNQDRICCLITTNPYKEDILITKDSFESGKLPFKSFIRPYRIFTINEFIIKKKLCTINNNFYNKIIEQVNEYIKIS
jgi:mRNA interferase MazF